MADAAFVAKTIPCDMKKCTYCGKEYPDDAVKCIIDENPLSGGEPLPPETEEATTPTLPVLEPEWKFPQIILTDRQMRIFELVLVCTISFGASILGSIFLFFDSSTYSSTSRNEYAWTAQVLRQGACLTLLWYVLMRRGKSFSDLGLTWSRKDIIRSIILALGASLAFRMVYNMIHSAGLTTVGIGASHEYVGHLLFGGGIFLSTILVQFVNPFFEELIVRAYLMTEVKYLTNSITKAIIISTVLQASYHLYQGGAAAFSHLASFLIFSIYFGKTNRITPIILAHLYSDVGATLIYWFRQ